MYILNSRMIVDFHLIATSIAHTCVNFSRFEKSRRRYKVAWKMARLRKQPRRHVPHCYELCALNPYFSQRLRARLPLAPHRLTCGWRNVTVDMRPDRVAASKTGYGESTKERTIASVRGAQWTRRWRAKEMFAYAYACSCVFRRKGNRTIPCGNYIRAVKLSQRMHVHATRPVPRRAHTGAHAARGRNVDNGPDYKIWNEFVGISPVTVT